MKQILLTIAFGVGALLGSMPAASARPPTVQFSPGYEMRLAEQRARLQRAQAQRLKTVRPAKHRGKR